MKYLLDTHSFIWSFMSPEKLSSQAKELIEDGDNEILICSTTFWEIAEKHQQKKMDFGPIDIRHLPNIATQYDFTVLNPEPYDYITVEELPNHGTNLDSYERILIHTAIRNNLMLISNNEKFIPYKEDGLQLVW